MQNVPQQAWWYKGALTLASDDLCNLISHQANIKCCQVWSFEVQTSMIVTELKPGGGYSKRSLDLGKCSTSRDHHIQRIYEHGSNGRLGRRGGGLTLRSSS